MLAGAGTACVASGPAFVGAGKLALLLRELELAQLRLQSLHLVGLATQRSAEDSHLLRVARLGLLVDGHQLLALLAEHRVRALWDDIGATT